MPFLFCLPLLFLFRRTSRDTSSCFFSQAQRAVDRSPVPPDKGAIEELVLGKEGRGFYSHYFLATKKTGGFRPILNLTGLNAYLLIEKFRMEILASILQDLQKGMWMISLDLKDAYLHVSIVPRHRQFLRDLRDF